MRTNSESIRVVFPRSLMNFRVNHLNGMSKDIYVGMWCVSSIERFIYSLCVISIVSLPSITNPSIPCNSFSLTYLILLVNVVITVFTLNILWYVLDGKSSSYFISPSLLINLIVYTYLFRLLLDSHTYKPIPNPNTNPTTIKYNETILLVFIN